MNQPQFQIILSQTQASFIQAQLPAGFSLQLSDQHQSREIKRAPSFKFSIENQSPRAKRPTHTQQATPHKPQPQQILPPEGDLLIIPLPKQFSKPLVANPVPQQLGLQPLLLTKSRSKKSSQCQSQQQLMSQKQFSQCQKILHSLRRHHCIGPFLYPVDPVKQGLSNYFEIVKNPMDLATIDKKLKRDEYNTQSAFINDLNRMVNNALVYHSVESEMHQLTTELQQYIQQLCATILDRPIYTKTGNNNKSKTESVKIDLLKKKIAKLQGQIKKFGRDAPVPQLKKGRHKRIIPPTTQFLPMSIQEKKKLGQNIRRLPAQYLQGLWRLVRTGIKNIDNGTEEIEIDIDQLSVPKTRELERYVNTKIKMLNRIQQKERKLQKSRENLQIGRIEEQMMIVGNIGNIGNQEFIPQFPQHHQQQQHDQIIFNEPFPDLNPNVYNLMNQENNQKPVNINMGPDQVFEKSERAFHYANLRKNSNISMGDDSGFQNN